MENGSDSNFENLSVEYWLIVDFDKKGKGEVKTYNKSTTINSLAARGEFTVQSPTITLTLGADSGCATCPKVIARASEYGRDRIIGTKVVVRDSTGKEIFNESSSNRVEAELAKTN